MEHLIVKQRRPFQLLLAVVILSLLISTVVWFFLDENHWTYIESRHVAARESKQLWETNRRLIQENRKLNEKLIMLERAAQIDGQSAAQMQYEIRDLQDEIYRLRAELEFYEGIMTSARATDGLSIQGLYIEPMQEEQNYRFKLILTLVSKSDKVAEGMVEMTLEGLQDGAARVLNFEDLVLNLMPDLTFKFKNFKRLEGNMVLPEGFIPQRVIVRLHSKDKTLSNIERVFSWSETTG
jgi:hypothetical protein